MTATTTDVTTTLDQRVLDAATGTLELFGVYLGDRLGLYDALRDTPRTAPELSAAAGIAPRYAREWLEQQAVAGVLTVDDPGAEPGVRRYALPDSHVGVLADPVALDHVRLSRGGRVAGRVGGAGDGNRTRVLSLGS